ncbi:hypothetical protein [Thalassoroseus pseudoceratinae]|uniref:hypothetical protein n=1 Tax=Thalassoroseus pseudoceratinae TaxID=2713176 RepID=UPI001423719C|nr:hypothetical protein [Thalassoroseus pseudoceratinae]
MPRESSLNDRSEAIQAELKRVLASEDFLASQHMTRFLRFIVEETLAGNGEHLKERTIALNALGRGGDFDSRLDPVVRVVAGKLRRALDRYYAKQDGESPVTISVPKGGYRPKFCDNDRQESTVETARENSWTLQTSASDPLGRPVVAILPFAAFGCVDQLRTLADGLAQDLCVNLSRFSWIQVVDYLAARSVRTNESNPVRLAARLKADFFLTGTIREIASEIRVTLQFVRSDRGVVIWADSFDFRQGNNLQESLDQLASGTALLLGDLFGVLSRAIRSASLNTPLESATAIETLFRFFEYETHLGDVGYDRVLNALTKIVKAFPDFSMAWGALATLHLNGVSMLAKTKARDASQQAHHCIENALKADPTCAFAHWNAGLYHLMHGQQEEGVAATERAIDNASGSSFELGAAGALLNALDQGEQGQPLINEAVERNPALPGWIKWGAAIGQMGSGRSQDAIATSEQFTLPDCFWDPMLRSVALADAGEKESAGTAMRQAKKLRPELAHRPQELVGRIVTNPEVKNQILEQVQSAIP